MLEGRKVLEERAKTHRMEARNRKAESGDEEKQCRPPRPERESATSSPGAGASSSGSPSTEEEPTDAALEKTKEQSLKEEADKMAKLAVEKENAASAAQATQLRG